MYFYEVWVRSARYHGQVPLTYQSEQHLHTGALIEVPLQHQTVIAVVLKSIGRPTFKTKPISLIYQLPPLPLSLIQLSSWLTTYYPAPLGNLAKQLVPPSLNDTDQPQPAAADELDLTSLPPLTSQQTTVLAAINRPDSYLLHGSTGSGKTRIYLELAYRAIQANKSAIILTPEISLTSQLAEQFQAIFGNRVVILHSQLTPKQRRQVWQNILTTIRPLVVIGPRSALFSPLSRVGLIVLDEAHEPAYKQDQAPHYQTGRVAAKLAQLTGSILVLGSATPSVSDYFLAEQKHKPILRLSELAVASNHTATALQVVDLKDRSQLSRSPYLSQALLKAIEIALINKHQVLLYLNRRGTARLVLCENCGWQAICPHCDLPLTYHGDSHKLRCHICNHQQTTPPACPSCANPSIIFRAVGTKAVAADISRLFPGSRVARFDTDNTKAERFEQHFKAVQAGQVDIIVGTQLLAKGLDLPRLSTLGIITADTSLALPDFSANERTFQLLSQVLGRVGRGHVAGRAIIQSYQPDHPVIKAAIDGDWTTYYESELASRKLFNFPPYCFLLKLVVRRASIKAAEQAADNFSQLLSQTGLKITIDGPAPAFHEKFQSKYQWQLVIKSKNRSELLSVIKLLPSSGWRYDIDPLDLL